MTRLLAMLLMFAAAADITGKWNFVWQTPGGERRSTLTFNPDGNAPNKIKVEFPGAKEPMQGTLDGDKLTVTGDLYSAEAGSSAAFRLNGTVSGQRIKGTASWAEHEMTFEAAKAAE